MMSRIIKPERDVPDLGPTASDRDSTPPSEEGGVLTQRLRCSQMGLLRAVGQTRGQLRSMVRWESVIVATLGVVGGIGLGVFLGWALVEAARNTPGSIISQFVLPGARLAIVVVVGAVAGVLAGLRPARRAARLDVLAAIAAE